MGTSDRSLKPGGAAPRYTVRPYNQRLARRIARRAGLDEQGIAVAFTFNNLLTTMLVGPIEDVARLIPTIGGLLEIGISVLTFYFRRIVLVAEQNVYVYRDWPFHIPGKLLTSYRRHPGVVRLGGDPRSAVSRFIRRGQLSFEDGFVVYHSFVWIRRAQYVAQEANALPGL